MVFQTLMSFWWFRKCENKALEILHLTGVKEREREKNLQNFCKTMNFSYCKTLTCFITKTITKQTNKVKMCLKMCIKNT